MYGVQAAPSGEPVASPDQRIAGNDNLQETDALAIDTKDKKQRPNIGEAASEPPATV
jgi:hypothetical protein